MSIVSGIVSSSGGTSTSDATAEQWHIKSGKTAYIASGKVTGNAYTPALMDFDGSTGYYSGTLTTSGNKLTYVCMFNILEWNANDFYCIAQIRNPANTFTRLNVLAFSTDWTADGRDGRILVEVSNTSGAAICSLTSPADTYLDGNTHTLHFAFDGDAGTAVYRIDGTDADDTGSGWRTAPTTGTLPGGASSLIKVGATVATTKLLNGQAGFLGYIDAYKSTWSDFMRSDGAPIYQDPATSWSGSGFGAQPAIFNPHGDLVNNLGSAGAMTKNGTINVGDGGAT